MCVLQYRFKLEDQLGIARKPSLSQPSTGAHQPGSLSLDRRSDSSLESKVSMSDVQSEGANNASSSGGTAGNESGLGSSVKTLSTVSGSTASDLNRQIKNIDLNSEVSVPKKAQMNDKMKVAFGC